MYTEEAGVPRLAEDGGAATAAGQRPGRAGRENARVVDGKVVFKAELAVVTKRTAQIQGVWVRRSGADGGSPPPPWQPWSATVAAVAPTVSLYVNDFNLPARRVYERLARLSS